MPRRTPDNPIRKSSGNVFEDLRLPKAGETLAKAEIARHIASIISKRGLTQSEASKLLGIDQPKVSALLRGQLSGFSTERLFRFVTTLGRDVEISITPKAPGHAHGEIRVLKKVAAGVA